MLLSIKSYIRLLLLLAIINLIPAFVFYGGKGADGNDETFAEWLWRFNLGNIGPQNSESCGYMDLSRGDEKVDLVCPYGKFKRIIGVGFNK